MKKYFKDGKLFVFEHFLAVASLGLFFSFPTSGVLQEMISSIIFLIVFPLTTIHFIFKKPLREYGIIWIPGTRNFLTLFLALAGSLGALYAACYVFPAIRNYQVPMGIAENFWFFLLYAMVISVVSAAVYEVVFRAVIFQSWARSFGAIAIVAQFAMLTLLLAFTEGVQWVSFPVLLSALISGAVMYRTKSLFFSFLFSWLFGIMGDVLIIYFFR